MGYYIYQGDKPIGPMSLDDLQARNIIPSTPVWKEGLAGWVHASTLDELKEMFSKKPPDFQPIQTAVPNHYPSVSSTEKIGYRVGKSLRTIAVIIAGILAVYLYFGWINKNNPSSANYLPAIISDPEHTNPALYLTASGFYHTNFWNDKFVLNGKVTNNASHTNYKDIRVKVSFLSPTKTVLSSEEYVIYDYVPYGSTKEFTLKLAKPPVASSCGMQAMTATYY